MNNKGMFHTFYPDDWVDSTYDIDFERLYEEGYRGLIFDIDNTLVPHGAPVTEEVKEFFKRLSVIGFPVTLISNNKEPRVKPFADAVGVPYIHNAGKPGKKNYLEAAMEMMCEVSQVVFIGDQLFTDVWGAKRCGIYSILVKPINPKEEIQIVLKRYLERIVLHFFKKNCSGQINRIKRINS